MSSTAGLSFLTGDDFSVVEGPNGRPIMVHQFRGLSMVMFYSNSCSHCQTLLPVFKELPKVVNGAHFALANVSSNKSIVAKARSTNTPIEYVPLVIFYVDGAPFAQYTGEHNLQAIVGFIKEMAQRARSRQQFAPSRPGVTPIAQEAEPQQQQRMPPQQPPMQQQQANPNAGGFGVPAAMTRGNNGQGGVPTRPPQQQQQEAPPTPLDEESMPYKPNKACYMSFDDFYG